MTKSKLVKCFVIAGGIYILALCCGIVIRVFDETEGSIIYNTFKDLIPFVIVVPATWLGYCLQQRNSYMQQLRVIWSNLVNTIQSSAQYTFLEQPTQQQYSDILKQISISIDEIRGVFENLQIENDEWGLYPFEPLKDVWNEIAKLKPELKTTLAERNEIRQKVFEKWKEMRGELLKEFDRHEPSNPVTPYK